MLLGLGVFHTLNQALAAFRYHSLAFHLQGLDCLCGEIKGNFFKATNRVQCQGANRLTTLRLTYRQLTI